MGTTEPVGLKRCPIPDVSEPSSRYRSSPPVSAHMRYPDRRARPPILPAMRYSILANRSGSANRLPVLTHSGSAVELQSRLDATAERAIFAEVPWIPREMKEVVDFVVAC